MTDYTCYINVIHCRFSLLFSKVSDQCYDGAPAMAGCKSGVATKLLQEEPKVLYTHCYGHAMNSTFADGIEHSKVMKWVIPCQINAKKPDHF